jgi:excinuclease UvrABC helicase subunit UvrB
MKDLFALLLGGGDLNPQNSSGMEFPKDNDPNWSKVVETQETKTHLIKIETWTSKDGGCVLQRSSMELRRSVDVNKLKRLLAKAVQNEEYEKAAELRDKIKAAGE